LWLREICGRVEGVPPSVDLQKERENAALVRRLIETGIVTAVHDISDGGLLVALTEMALANGMGMTISALDSEISATAFAFAEDQGRYLVATNNPDQLRSISAKASVPIEIVAVVDAQPRLRWHDVWQGADWTTVALADLRAAHEGFFPRLMGADAALA
jgi:phosphoribosylformylglycinamidine synthase